MNFQHPLFKDRPNISDIVFTPEYVAVDIIKWLNPAGVCLDPCKGDGAFYNNFPNMGVWCEITEGRDFFDFNERIDWVIGNPPYSLFEQFLFHSFNIADDVCFLVPTNKIFQRLKIMKMINNFGNIKGMRIYGSGQNINFPFGFSVGAFHFSRGHNGTADIVLSPFLEDNPKLKLFT